MCVHVQAIIRLNKGTVEMIYTFIHTGNCYVKRHSPPLVLSDRLLLGAGLSHCVPAQLAEHLKEVKKE